MGFSRGGQATLYASLKRFQRMWNKSGVNWSHIPFYPDCMTTYLVDADLRAGRSASSAAHLTTTILLRFAKVTSNG